jgi:defect-in-organelle-trafficking protein DotD
MKLSRGVSLLVLAAAAAGCASTPAPPMTPDSEAYARQVIVGKVDAAVQAQRDLAAATQEGQALLMRKQAALEVDEVDIDYIGEPQPLLEALAYRYGYKYVETGKHTELATVNLRVQKQRVPEVLRDVGYQISVGADLMLDESAKILRLTYKKS